MTETPALRREPLTEEAIDLLKRTECKGWTAEQVELFVYQCNRTGLDPLTRQIYGQLRWDKNLKDNKGKKVGGLKLTVVTSIDGFRLVAERTGEYEGQQGPFWCGADGVWKDVWIPKTYPAASKVGVWRKNFREPTFGVANFDAYAPTYDDGNLSGMWPKMFALMIAKCAEALALRKAFPNELSGLYTSDEMAQAGKEEEPKEQRKPDASKGESSAHAEQDGEPPEEDPTPDPAEEPPSRPAGEGRSGPSPSKGLAGSNIRGLKRKPGSLGPAPTPDNPMRHPESDNDGAGFPVGGDLPDGIDQWAADNLRKIETLGGKTLGQLRPDQLQKLADMGDAYVTQGKKLDKEELAKRALAGAKALIVFNDPENDKIPGL